MREEIIKFRVCLINPPVLSVLEPWYDTPDFGRTGLAYIAGFLREHTNYEIKIIDSKLERLSFNDVIKKVVSFNPDVIGITAFTNEIKPGAYLAYHIKRKIPGCITVIGGAHVTAIPVETLEEFSQFDFGVVGEGEITFNELCEAIRLQMKPLNHNDLKRINGIVFRNESDIILTEPRERILNQDEIPFPAWDMLPKSKTYYIQSIRGCPFNCLFCMNPNGRVARKRSVENVIAEINWIIKEFNPQRISFGDELFSIDVPRTHQLLKAMAKEDIGQKVKWDVQTHVQYVNYELFQDFKKANVERVELGIETGDEETLRRMGKGTNMKLILSACDAAKKAGVKIGSFFLLGQPNETKESIEKTVALAVKINPDLPMFGLMTPYPGTEIAKIAAKGEGGYKLLSTDWDEYNKQIGGAMEFANLTRSEIEWIQIKAYLKVYLYNYRFADMISFIFSYRQAAWEVLKKMLLQRKSIVKQSDKPSDYDDVLTRSGKRIKTESLISSRDEWNKIQKMELKRKPKALT